LVKTSRLERTLGDGGSFTTVSDGTSHCVKEEEIISSKNFVTFFALFEALDGLVPKRDLLG
jgi:hypothetical protein